MIRFSLLNALYNVWVFSWQRYLYRKIVEGYYFLPTTFKIIMLVCLIPNVLPGVAAM